MGDFLLYICDIVVVVLCNYYDYCYYYTIASIAALYSNYSYKCYYFKILINIRLDFCLYEYVTGVTLL